VESPPRLHHYTLFETYGKSGDDEAHKSWVAKTLPHLQEHLAMAEKLSQC